MQIVRNLFERLQGFVEAVYWPSRVKTKHKPYEQNRDHFPLGRRHSAVLAIGILRTWKTQGSAITWRTSDTALIVQSPSLGAPRPDPAPYPNVDELAGDLGSRSQIARSKIARDGMS